MNISLNWLSTHLDLSGKSIDEISDLFTFAGVEVEGIVTKGIASEKIVVGQIMEAVQHPDADKLKVTQVDAGEGQLRQIVCGAKNYKVGDKVPCCLPGADLGGFVIGETKMRGVESKGMLAAAEEIGLPKGEDGLLILPEDSPVGVPVKTLFDSDTLLELEVTPNRPDLLSHAGMGRELATLLKTPLLTEKSPETATAAASADFIKLESAEACPFYTATRIDNVTVTESPDWLKERLTSIGLRPINNVVDITNYVLHETGQPLHAFDASKVSGALVIRHATDGEKFIALDESEHTLTPEDLLISDKSGAALALAGVMGGLDSGVTESTTSILLESAYFSPSGIRRTSRRTFLSSDSSYRFERGADPQAVLPAAALAIKLMESRLPDGSIQTAGKLPEPPSPVTLDLDRLHHLLGDSISTEAAEEILTRLGLNKLAEGKWAIPSFRQDLTRHIDLAEEITRVHGLDNVPSRLRATLVPTSDTDAAYDADMILRRRLAALGLYECQTIKLIAENQMTDILPLRPLQDGDIIRVKSPLSEDHAIMRPSIVPGLVASAERNARQQAKSLRLFEMGRVFRNAGGGKAKDQESDNLAILVSGNVTPSSWAAKDRPADLYDAKAILSALLPGHAISLKPKDRENVSLAADIKAGDQTIGAFARLSLKRERDLDFTHPVFIAELDLGKLRKLILGKFQVEPLPQFPGSTRDAAMELGIDTPNADIEAALGKANEALLVSYECFDLFTDPSGEKIPADRKSIAYRFNYRDSSRTLKQQDVDAAHKKVLEALGKVSGLTFR
ncbi:MAG: phenylalanine--tRNA ligase subunit beta [Akkermansiaceae bacterium]|jgi:phenylalanyl-tRNA synthetase beta chain|nr:phenylalanine--tRNA ligase subunit beta [Akkermansiaceae bacterium]MDP4645502.1 phenylalanine--tRNA ligase subunit beta [Akkermansiaceae bacterium]MDP4719845.1 phenylalanine--tRNA ligase subunit beta [Akkermansiaceae bacterium]MDP4778691.1 phenylalanine--tRNA ligase subunit beta [Akkermansiaceae bacterium]MDP4848283.1 phenylalanine--tRNA ligase subunit beta [Akkermansiaceae bacterium]